MWTNINPSFLFIYVPSSIWLITVFSVRSMALVHDNELACMDVAPRTALRTHEYMGQLRKSAPTIQNFQCELPFGNECGPGADVAVQVAKVATLSEHAFGAPCKGSDWNPAVTAGGATNRFAPVASLATYDKTRIETEIGLLHKTLTAVNAKISNMALVNENFAALSVQMEPRHLSIMASRNEIRSQLITFQRGIQNKARSLQVSGENEVEDMDAHIGYLEVHMRSTRKKRPKLQKIDDRKRIPKVVVESFQADSEAIDAEYAAIEKLQKWLVNLQIEAPSERYYSLEAKVDVMKREVDLFGDPSLLFEQQHKLQRQINTLFSERYDLISRLRKDDIDYSAILNKYHVEYWSAKSESEISMQVVDEIKDCQTLIEYFFGISPTAKTGETKERSEFKKGHSTSVTGMRFTSFPVPFDAPSALRSLLILPPSSPTDVLRVVDTLKTRKARLEEIAEIRCGLLGVV